MRLTALAQRPCFESAKRVTGWARATRGVTLIEMLIVIVIVLSLTAMTIPVIAPMLTQRKSREAARMVSVFINGARNRALQLGRPYGFMMERIPGLEEGCATLAYAEVPDPFCGSYINSQAIVRFLQVPFFGAPYDIYTGIAEVRPWQGTLANGTIDLREYWGAPGQAGSINPGDLIQFNFQGDMFYLQPYKDSGGGATWIIAGFYHAAGDPDPWRGTWWVFSDTYSQNNVGVPFFPIALPYQIYRIPQKSPAGEMSLPEGTLIDLNFSGMAPSGTNPAIPPFHPRTLATDRTTTGGNASDVATSHYYGVPAMPYDGINKAPTGVDSQPILITFRSTGLVGLVYQRRPTPDPKSGVYKWSWAGLPPTGPIHLLIGKRERLPAVVPTSVTLSTTTNPPIAGTIAAATFSSVYNLPGTIHAQVSAASAANNWTDQNNLWVTIFPQSGMVVTSENSFVGNPASAPTSTAAGAGPAVPHLHLQAARTLSLGGRSMGGR